MEEVNLKGKIYWRLPQLQENRRDESGEVTRCKFFESKFHNDSRLDKNQRGKS